VDADSIVEKVLRIPNDFHRVSTVSPVVLLKVSGYFESPQVVNRDRVLAYLKRNPALADEWQIWANEQRAQSGWAFWAKDGNYEVFHLSGAVNESLTFHDRLEACAEFVLREIRAIAAAASDMTNWREAAIGFSIEPILIAGHNVWEQKWRQVMSDPVLLPHPDYPRQIHRYLVYEIGDQANPVRFAAGELSNGGLGFLRSQ